MRAEGIDPSKQEPEMQPLMRAAAVIALLATVLGTIWADSNPAGNRASLLDEKDTAAAEKHYNRGTALLEKHKYADGESELTTALDIDPDYFAALINRGICRREQGKYEKAIEDFNRAEELNPTHPYPYINRAGVYIRQQKWDEAEKDIDKTEEVSPGMPEVEAARGDIAIARKQYPEAMKHYNKVLAKTPDHYASLVGRGNIFVLAGKTEDAKRDFEKAIKLAPERAEAHSGLGIVFMDLKNYKDAEKKFKESIALNGYNREAMSNLGECFRRQGRKDDSLQAFNDVVKLFPEDRQALFGRALVHKCFGDFTDATEQLGELSKKLPDDAEVRVYYADSLRQAGRFDEAIVEYTTLADADASNFDAHYERGLCYYAQDEIPNATSDFETASGLNPRDHKSVAMLAMIEAVSGKDAAADDHIKQSLERAQELKKVMGTRPWGETALAEAKAAKAAVLTAQKGKKKDIETLQNEAVAHLEAGIELGYVEVASLPVNPLFEGLAKHKGFQKLLKPKSK
jgi:tetratricopeptide (TPR) repeat protein